jgi:hypothetical protein
VPPGRRSDVQVAQMPNRDSPYLFDILRSDFCASEISELLLADTLMSPGTQ